MLVLRPQVACGDTHSLCVTADGSVWAWGTGFDGRLGHGTAAELERPSRIVALEDVSRVFAAAGSSAAVTASGTLYTWGSCEYGQLGQGDRSDHRKPRRLALPDVAAVSLGQSHTGVVAGGALYTMGYSSRGRLGYEAPDDALTATRVPVEGDSWVDVACGEEHTAVVRNDGTVHAWGGSFGRTARLVYEGERAIKVVCKGKGLVVLTQSGASHAIRPGGEVVSSPLDRQSLSTLCCCGDTVMGIAGQPEGSAEPAAPEWLGPRISLGSAVPMSIDVISSNHFSATIVESPTKESPSHPGEGGPASRPTEVDPEPETASGLSLPAEFRDLAHLWDASSSQRAPPLPKEPDLPILNPRLRPTKKNPSQELLAPAQLQLQSASHGLGREVSMSVTMKPEALEPHTARHEALYGAESLPAHLQAKMDDFTRSIGLGASREELPSRKRASAGVAELADQLEESKGDANVLLEWVQDLTKDSERVKHERDELLVRKNALQVENEQETATLGQLAHRNRSLKISLDNAMAKASAEERGMLDHPSWLQACDKNKRLRADLDNLKKALTMVKQDGGTIAKDAADAIVAKHSSRADEIYSRHSATNRALGVSELATEGTDDTTQAGVKQMTFKEVLEAERARVEAEHTASEKRISRIEEKMAQGGSLPSEVYSSTLTKHRLPAARSMR